LTGLPNRVLLIDRLDISLQRTAQSDERVALLLLNIDKFQMVNNSLGHHAGDELLQEVARRLRTCVRSDDLVARFTGDTFGILLEHISSEADAINVIMRIQRAFATPMKVTGVDVYVTISTGIALSSEQQNDAKTLIRYSDIALNRAKEAGGGDFAIFSPSKDLSRVPKIELQSRLHRALAADALELYYQPVMSLGDQRVAGYEALVRWTDKQFGRVTPDEFLPLAQQSGIMSEITAWVLDRAVTQLCDWRDRWGETIFAAVNISPSEMNDHLLVEQVDAVLRRYQVDPACMILEMTEQALLDTSGHPRAILQRLRNLGVRIALDDFGTGYSSLSYLEYLPIDGIKIDRAFIQAARGGASRAPVATAMVDLARKLGMVSVAEGIETEEDERVARQLGCDFSQGYFYGRPQPGERVGRSANRFLRAD
jgi:diguanylate cyclase (GGDEF)-like protein